MYLKSNCTQSFKYNFKKKKKKEKKKKKKKKKRRKRRNRRKIKEIKERNKLSAITCYCSQFIIRNNQVLLVMLVNIVAIIICKCFFIIILRLKDD